MIDRGDLIAQCNVSPLADRSAEKPLSLAQYRHDVEHALGERFDRILTVAEWTDDHGQLVYRVVAHGEVEKLPIEWRYYLIAHPSGSRTAIVFTVEAPLAERFDDADRQLVDTLQIGRSNRNQPGKKLAPATADKSNPAATR